MAFPFRLSELLDLGFRRVFRWIFVIADTSTPIIGADFLREHGILVNMKHGRLIDMTTELQTRGTISRVVSPSPSFSLQHNTTEYDALLTEFPAVTKPLCIPTRTTHCHSSYPHHRSPSACQSQTPTT